MANIFSLFTQTINEIAECQNHMKWYQKINPFYRNKIKRMISMMDKQIQSIKMVTVNVSLLQDFQNVYITNSILSDNLIFDLIKISYTKDMEYKPGFYRMSYCFNTYQSLIIDMVTDVITLELTGNGNYVGRIVAMGEFKEEFQPDPRCDVVRYMMMDYMTQYIKKIKI